MNAEIKPITDENRKHWMNQDHRFIVNYEPSKFAPCTMCQTFETREQADEFAASLEETHK